jgi:putative transposase
MPGYVPDKHHRQSIRLKGYDYAQEGAYFITICTKARELYFELYPELKSIVQAEWESLPERFPDITLDAFVIMPNHIHAIILVGTTLAVAPQRAGSSPAPTLGEDRVEAPLAVAPQRAGASPAPTLGENMAEAPLAGVQGLTVAPERAGASPAPTLGDIVGAFKSLCVNMWLRYIRQNNINALGSIWQKNYYEHSSAVKRSSTWLENIL